jgi:hypothetical protein
MEQLVGKPSSEIIDLICRRHSVRAIWTGTTEMFKYANPPKLEVVQDRSLESPHWVRNVKRRMDAQYLNLVSKVMLNATFGHIPMVDFDGLGRPKEEVLPDVEDALLQLGFPDGILAFSGNGYHYLSQYLVTEDGFRVMTDELRKRMGELPVVDKKWVLWTEGNRYGQIRITRGPEKPVLPVVEKIFYAPNLQMNATKYQYSVLH